MDKKTIFINLLLVFLICVVGIGFASYVFLSKSKPDFSDPKNDTTLVFDPNSVLSNNMNQYSLDFSLKYLEHDYFYSGTVNRLKNQCDFVDNNTEEKINVTFCDMYQILQQNVPIRSDWQGDSISFPISEHFNDFKTFFQEFFDVAFNPSSLVCEISVSDTGFILDSICSFDNSKIKFSFYFDE